jgi:uncharacterized protein
MNGKRLNWMYGGLLLGIVMALAMILAKPVGGSTQFVIADGIIWNSISPLVQTSEETKTGYTSENSYLAKSDGKHAKAVANPINYGFIFVLSVLIGGLLSKYTQGPNRSKDEAEAPTVWTNKFGINSTIKRYIISFIGGVLIIFGARLAGGCTSGHMMSGMMQTSISGYLFTFGVFIVAVPIALLFYAKKELK